MELVDAPVVEQESIHNQANANGNRQSKDIDEGGQWISHQAPERSFEVVSVHGVGG
jgi:hypothetical protein